MEQNVDVNVDEDEQMFVVLIFKFSLHLKFLNTENLGKSKRNPCLITIIKL